MSNILFVKSGSKLSIKNNSIVVNIEETNKKVPIYEISSIIIENLQCSITAGVNVLCSSNNVPIFYCDKKHSPVALSSSFNTYYRQHLKFEEQLKWTNLRKRKLFQKIVVQKIENQLELLKYLNRDITVIRDIEIKLSKINKDNFDNIEAQVAKIYFNELFGNDFIRFKDDEINASLNYGYAILRGNIKQVIVAKGLIPSLGLWHKNQFNNYNLADDVIEVFRPMVDYVTFHFLIKDDDFTNKERQYLQNILFQKVKYGNNTFEYIDCLSLYVDQIIKYMNKEITELDFPITDSEVYEY